MVMTGIYWSGFFISGIYCIHTVCTLFRMRYADSIAEYILKLKNLYMFYIKYILPGLVDVLGIYLRYDKIRDILLQNVATLVYVQVIGYMLTGMEFKRIVCICSFFEFPTRSHIPYNLNINQGCDILEQDIPDVVISQVYTKYIHKTRKYILGIEYI